MKKQLLVLALGSFVLLVMGSHNVDAATVFVKNSGSQSKQAEIILRQDMRKLWTEHVIWTRDYIVAAVAGAPDASAASVRLLQNQGDIGAAIAKYYGKAVGAQLTDLLKQHILIAVELIDVAKVNDRKKFQTVNSKWQQNGREIADFLCKANPFWSQASMREMMNVHLATTEAELTARINKKYEEDVRSFGQVYLHILMMSDVLSQGIIKQFPKKF